MENRGKRQAASIFGGMGFYIALLVCVVAAGVVGYFALLNDGTDKAPPSGDDGMIQSVDQVEPDETTPVTAPDDTPSQPVMSDRPLVVSGPPEEEMEEEAESTAPTLNMEPVAQEPQETAPVSSSVPKPVTPEPFTVVSPLLGETVAVFSVDELIYDATLGDWRTHDGIDVQAPAGTAVSAVASGTVLAVEEDARLGTTVVIDHNNGYITTYASLHPEPMVQAGDSVSAGTVIGAVGNTSLTEAGLGAHLHFSVTKDGETIDPEEFLK